MNFVFRYMKVLGSSIESLARIAADVAAKVNNDATASELATMLEKSATDAAFKDAFVQLSVQETKLAYFVVYYLEKRMLNGTIPLQHGDEQNLEHIMPKSPTVTYWPDADAWKKSDAEEYKEYLWRIGNLLPLPASINKSLKNREISYKLKNGSGKEYESDGLSLASPKKVRTYLDNGQWNKKAIADRQQALAEHYSCAAWSLS
jgi:hypothetical protein